MRTRIAIRKIRTQKSGSNQTKQAFETMSDLPWVVGNEKDDVFHLISSREHFNSVTAESIDGMIDCYQLTIVNIPLQNIFEVEHYKKRIFNEQVLNKQIEKFKMRQQLPPIFITENEGSEIFYIVAGQRRFRIAKQAGLTEIPCVLLPLKEPAKENIRRLDFIHDFGEFEICHHPTVNAQYNDLRAQLLPKINYPDAVTSDIKWLETISIWVNQSLNKLAKDMIFNKEHLKFSNWLLEQFILHPLYKELASDLASRIAKEGFRVNSLANFDISIYNCFENIFSELSDDFKLPDNTSELELPNMALNENTYIVYDGDLSRFENIGKIFHQSIAAYQLIKLIETSGVVTKNNCFRARIAAKFGLTNQYNLWFKPIFLSNVSVKIRERMGQDITTVTSDRELLDAAYQQIVSYLLTRISNVLGEIFKYMYKDQHIRQVILSKNEINTILIDNDLFSKIYGRKAEKGDEIVLNALYQDCVACLQFLNEPAAIAKQLILNFKAEFEVSKHRKKALFGEPFANMMMEKRNTINFQYPYLSIWGDDLEQVSASSPSDVFAILCLTWASYKRHIKEMVREKAIFFNPRVGFDLIKNTIINQSSEALVVDEDGKENQAIQRFKISDLGVATLEQTTSKFGIATAYLRQFSNYPNEYTLLVKFIKSHSTNKLSDQEIAEWMHQIINCKAITDQNEAAKGKLELNSIKKLNNILFVLCFCLFYIEISRNTGSSVTHGLMLLNIIAGECSLNDGLVNRQFPMAPVGATENGRYQHDKFVPTYSFFKEPRYLPSDTIRVLQLFLTDVDNLDQRELEATKNTFDKKTIPETEEIIFKVFNL